MRGRPSFEPPVFFGRAMCGRKSLETDADVVKALLSKLAFRKAIGLYLGDQEIAVSKVAFTPLGPVEIASECEACTPENAEEVIKRLIKPLLSHKRRSLVAVGLPSARIFFGTRLTRAGADVTPESVLQKAFSSTNIRIDDLSVDLLKSAVNKVPIASVAACRKKYMTGVIAILNQLRVRPFCAEPEACALVRVAAQQGRFPRRAKTVLCVFLNATHGLAVMTVGGVPLAWRQFILPAGSEDLAILSAARTLETQQKHNGIESAPSYALICGREDVHERLRRKQFPSDMARRVIWHDGPSFSGRAAAYGLALGCLGAKVAGFDLSREMKLRAPIAEIFPWADLVFAAFLVAVMAVVLGFHAMDVSELCAQVEAKSSLHTCLAAGGAAHVEQDEKALEQKVDAVCKFLDSRILWTSYTYEISQRLPPNSRLRLFQGLNALDVGGKQGSGNLKKLLLLRATALYAGDNVIPHEIDEFLNALRNDKLLKHDFASVELADIKRAEGLTGRGQPEATFTVVCSPKASGGGGGGKEAK
jgi:hypothetical protein